MNIINIKILRFLTVGLVFLISCGEKQTAEIEIKQLETQTNATNVYFTKDNNDNPVLCWTAKTQNDSAFKLQYAFFDAKNNQFTAEETVLPSVGCSNSSESANKIIFKKDGTMVAVFGKPFKNEKNRFAGAIYYSLSFDSGKTWSSPAFIHSTDTSHSFGRGFFDLAKNNEGEIVSVWLDGRFGKSIKGSALYFAQTTKGAGFSKDSCLYKGTCECCRTGLITDEKGNMYIAFRYIWEPNISLKSEEVRDIAFIYSGNNGKTFSPPKLISNDGWKLNGCPHTGPSLSLVNNNLSVAWFTSGDGKGINYTVNKGRDSEFQHKTLITATGRHPQMVTLKDGRQAIVCEETHILQEKEPSHGKMPMHHNHSVSEAKIVLRILNNGNVEKEIILTDGKYRDHNAVITPLNDGLLVAWSREENGNPKIYYTQLSNNF